MNVAEAFKQVFTSNEVITPNGDGLNDALVIEDFDAASSQNKSTIAIYSQWGELVFKAAPYMNNWNGTFDKSPLPNGTYYFIFKANSTAEVLKSFITVLR